jgi:SSS family transporter
MAISGVDVAILSIYLLAITAVGVWTGRGQRSAVGYFLGDRSLPTAALLLSIVATETSAVTFLSVPGWAYAAGGDLRFLQITFGFIVGRLLIVAILLPLYFRGEPLTAYEVLQRRFGTLSRRATSAVFLVTRTVADAFRLYLSALVLQAAMGLELSTSVVLFATVSLAYTLVGGVKSVVWNDCIQFGIYILGAALALAMILHRLPGGWEQFQGLAAEQGKLRVFDFTLSLTQNTMTFWAGLIGGCFLSGATHGVDQLMVQRLLAARSQRSAGFALASSGVVVSLQFLLFLIIGAALACFYATFPDSSGLRANEHDRVFAHFIVHELPHGLVGLTLAAVISAGLTTLSGSLNSAASVLVNDLVLPASGRQLSEAAVLRLSRLATALFAALQVGIALATFRMGVSTSVVSTVLGIASFTSGPMLGLYLLGVLTRVSQRSALGGFFGGLSVVTGVWAATPIWWPWYAAIGASTTFVLGQVLDLLTTDAPDVDSNRDKSNSHDNP